MPVLHRVAAAPPAWGLPRCPHDDVLTMIFITGASGRMGGAVLDHASGRIPTRAGARSARPIPGATETVRFDLDDASTFASALAGCNTLFLMRPPAATSRSPFDRLMSAAARAGVAHVVCASVWGAGRSRWLPHRHMEAAVRASGLPHTFLRPADFMQNLTGIHAAAIVHRREIAVPAGQGRSAFLDAADVGAATLAILANPAAHAGEAYDLTGPEALTFDDVAVTISRVLGRPVRYRAVSLPRFAVEQVQGGQPWGITLVMAVLYSVQRFGGAAPVSGDFSRLTGRPPGCLARFTEKERRRFG